MSDASEPFALSTNHDLVTRRPGRVRWQVGLRTLFLMTATIAVWMTYAIHRRENEALRSRITAMRPMAHELSIDDPTLSAVVMKDPEWFDDNQWEVYLPAGQYRLCMATRAIDGSGLAPVMRSKPLGSGRHHLKLEQRAGKFVWHVIATSDESSRLDLEEPQEWDPGRGSSGGGEYSLSTQLAPDQPLILFRRRFMRPVGKVVTSSISSTPSGPCEGVLLWIERGSKS